MRDASQTLQVPYEARLLLYRIFDRQVMAGYSRVLERLDDAMDAAGVLQGLTFVPVRVRATAQGGQETDGKPGFAAGATGDGHGTTAASGGDDSGGAAGRASPSEIGRASWRERGCQDVLISGGGVYLKKKNIKK